MNMSNILSALNTVGVAISGTHRITDKELCATGKGRLYVDERRRLIGIAADGVRLPNMSNQPCRMADITIRPPQGDTERAQFGAAAIKLLTDIGRPNGGAWCPDDQAAWSSYRAMIASLTA